MRQLLVKSLGLFSVLAVAMSGSAFADASQVAALQSEVSDLNGKVAALERMVKGMKGGSGSSYVPMAGEEGGFLQTAPGINMGGHLDVQYNMNFNQPYVSATTGGESTLRIYDNQSSQFALNAAEIYFEKAAEETGDAGFRLDLTFGNDATVTLADGLGGDEIDVQQAYIEYIAGLPIFEDSEILPDSVHIMAGRFATLAGFEVIEGPDNWNISRSVAYGFSIPFTHTGVRTNFGLFDDFFDVYLGVNNGWDLPRDNNNYKTLELGLGYSPLENVEMFHAFYWGAEKSGTAGGKRWVWTNTATVSVTDALTLAGEINYGAEHDLPDAARVAGAPTTPSRATNDADWYSFNFYANYAFTDRFSGTVRYELFRDDELARTGVTDTIFGQTYTLEYALTDNTLIRGEFRHDKSDNDNIFGDDTSRTSLGAQMIYLI